MKFSNAARQYTNLTRTENGAIALSTTGSPLVDLFGAVGALRKYSDEAKAEMLQSAIDEDLLLATKLMFYARDIRGGLGERETFRAFLKHMAVKYPNVVAKNIALIPQFGRYDDLYVLVDTPVEHSMWLFVKETIQSDLQRMYSGLPVSLCAKWLKSINTSSKNSVSLGEKTAMALKMTKRNYRKTLSSLRRYLDIPENKMSSKHWTEIDYEKVPSRAMKNYRSAFAKHDYVGFNQYLSSVEKGEKKINASALFPYDILMAGKLSYGYYSRNSMMSFQTNSVLEAQWKALPNYVQGENNILIMSDTSGSMEGLPMATSVGLAIYFAERNKGAYKNLFLTFSERPSFVELKGSTLREKIACVPSIVANTDLEKAFKLILDVALENNVSQEEMPKALIVISDMQFDEASEDTNNRIFYNSMKKRFVDSGYEMPLVIFWQVEERRKSYQAKMNQEGIILVSGHSPSIFKSILNNVGKTPRDFMLETLNSPAYACVRV